MRQSQHKQAAPSGCHLVLSDVLTPTQTFSHHSDTMADETKPGAPVNDDVKEIPQASEKSVAAEAKRRVPRLTQLAATPDRVLLRLNK